MGKSVFTLLVFSPKLVLSIRNGNKNVTDLIHKHHKKLILHESNKIQKAYFSLVIIFSTVLLFNCDKPKEISSEKFQTLIQKSSDLHVVTYLGIDEEKAILKVSTRSSIDSKQWKNEYTQEELQTYIFGLMKTFARSLFPTLINSIPIFCLWIIKNFSSENG